MLGGHASEAWSFALQAVRCDVVARTRDDEEDLVVHEIDLDEVRAARAMSHVFDTRVPAAYAAITEEIPAE